MLSPVLRRVAETARQGANQTGPLPLPLSLASHQRFRGRRRVAKSLYLNILVEGTVRSARRFLARPGLHGFTRTQHDLARPLAPFGPGLFNSLVLAGTKTEGGGHRRGRPPRGP